jgi:hypothetical protein
VSCALRVIILFMTYVTVLRILLIRSCAVKKLFRLSFYILPTAGCRQSLILPTAVTVQLWLRGKVYDVCSDYVVFLFLA